MTKLKRYFLALLLAVPAFAQMHTLTQTSTSAAMLSTDTVISLTSVTNVLAPNLLSGEPGSLLFVQDPGDPRGEAMRVVSISGTVVSVTRNGLSGAKAFGHVSGAMVLIGEPNWFVASEPDGACTAANTFVTPLVNIRTGNQWLCSTVTLSWVPGFQNKSGPAQPTTAVASVAGTTLPSGPLFHVTGTNAITAWTIPVGQVSDGFCIIPDAAYTTTATGNIALASTGVVSKVQCWTFDAKTAKFYPSY
jgi:hypothetical protein